MALLAEPRRRQKYSIDPRGLNWSKDEDKFGHKMLEKMGWTKGKGLGANEDGDPDHITVKHKADTRGVGCTKKHADNWLAHQDDFNSLLSALSADHGPDTQDDQQEAPVSVQSLEEKAQQQKSRVHYKKFTKGKDLSRYGSTDLDSILGKRKSASAPVTPQVQSEANSDTEEQKETTASKPDEEDKDDKSGSLFGVTTITNTTTIADYFAKKMAALKESRMRKDDADGERTEAGIEREDSNTSTVDAASGDNVDCSGERPKKKKKSRKSKENVCIEMSSEDSVEIEKPSEGCKKSKKSKKGKQCQGEETGCTDVVCQDAETVETTQKGKKSKKNKQCKDAENLSTEPVSQDSTGVETRLDSSRKCKESKKRKREEMERCNVSTGKNATNDEVSSKKRKKSTRKSDAENTQVDIKDCQPTGVELCDGRPADMKKTKTSKKEKREKPDSCQAFENTCGETQENNQITDENNKSIKKSKKKRKSCNNSTDDSELPEASVEAKSSKKLRKTENVTKTDQVGPDVASPKDEEQTPKQKLKRKKESKEKKKKVRKANLEKLEENGKGLGFAGSNLDDISGYGGGFIVQYPWADKK